VTNKRKSIAEKIMESCVF